MLLFDLNVLADCVRCRFTLGEDAEEEEEEEEEEAARWRREEAEVEVRGRGRRVRWLGASEGSPRPGNGEPRCLNFVSDTVVYVEVKKRKEKGRKKARY